MTQGYKVKRQDCKALLRAIKRAPDLETMAQVFHDAAECEGNPRQPRTAAYYLEKMAQWIDMVDDFGWCFVEPPFAIFTPGNSKLPFFSFSTLPGETCPGAGACLEWCYSFIGWRYPASFLRQVQNTILMATIDGRYVIEDAWHNLPDDCIVRLYVDGDFASVFQFEWWMDLISMFDRKTYGYSKSWLEILTAIDNGCLVPENYVLNISSGSIHDDSIRAMMLELPFAREVFESVSISLDGLPAGFERYDSREYHRRTREAYLSETGKRAFSCPGKCAVCRPNGMHACGELDFDVPIVIGIH